MDNEVQQFKGIYSSQYDLNLDIPVGMNKEQAQERFRIVNDSLQGDERAKWIGKPISWKDQENIIQAKAPQMGLWERGIKELWNTSLDIANMVNKGLWTAGASFGASVAADDMFKEEYYKTHKQPRTPLEKIAYEKAKEEWNKKNSAEISKSAGASEAISGYTDIVEQGKFDIPPAEPWSKEWAVSSGVNVAVPLIGGLGFGKMLELATVYGMGNYSDTVQTILQGGGTLKEATAKGVTSGILERELEKIAINQWGIALGLPRLQRYVRRYATGALQESSQAIKDRLILGDYDTRTDEQFQLDLASALIWGGFGECLGLAFRDVATKKSQAKLTKGIEKAGADKAVAKEISAGIFLDEKEVDLDKYKDVINERQNVRRAQAYDALIARGDSPETASAKAQDLVPTAESIISDVKGMLKNMPILSAEDIQRGQEFIEEAQRIGGKDADTYVNIMNTYKQVGKLGGLTEEEIRKDAEYFANAHTSLFLALKDKDPNLTYEQYADKIKLNSLRIIQDINVEREVNKRVKETLPWVGETSELTAEQVDEVERVAQNERYNVMREAGLIKEDDTLYSRVYVNGEEIEAFDDVKTAEGKPVNYSNEGNYYDTGINREARRGRDNTAIVRMSPQQFLGLTPERMGSRDVSAIESAINEGKEIAMPFLDVEILDADKKILKVIGHEGRHRSLAMSNLGVNDGYVILNGRDLYRNKDLFKDLSSWKILGQKETDESKAIPLSENKFPIYTDSTVNINGEDKTVYNSKNRRIAISEASLKNFYNWFKSSKIVDKKGRPLVVWHGTKSDFNTFTRSEDLGFHFGTKEQARTKAGYSKDSKIKGYYLSLQNPLEVSFDFGSWDAHYDLLLKFEREGILSDEEVSMLAEKLVGDSYLGWNSKDANTIKNYLFEKGGWDGIVYPNRFEGEGKSYIAFYQNQIKSVDNLGQFNPEKKNTLYSRYNASYSDAKKIIRLFKGHNPQALVHELSHNFFMDYFRLTEEYGLTEKNKAIYDMLGKKTHKEFGEKEWETITEEFMKYLKTNEAPNIALSGLFRRAKDWLIETFFTTNKSETPSPEVKEFFDNLVKDEYGTVDATSLRMTPRTIKDIIKDIKSGKEVSFRGVRRSDLKALRKIFHQTRPRKAKTLAEEMRKDDMRIKADSELAKQLGYDPKKKQPMFDKNGTIERIDELDDYLVEKGLLEPNQTETAEQVSDRENQIENIINQAEDVYSAEEQTYADYRDIVEQNQLKAQELVDEILKDNELGIKSIDEINEYLDKAIDMAKSVDSILVNKEAIKFLVEGYENAEKLYNKTLKELQKAQDVIGVRQQLTDYIRSLPLNAKHRLSLINKVKQVNKGEDFTEVLGNINDSFKQMWEQETKEILANNINEILKSTKPKERRKQKYNYDYNTLFEELRIINGYTKAQANEAYDALLNEIRDSDSVDYVETDEDREINAIKRLLISYKMNGKKDSSIALMKRLEDELFKLRQDAIEDKARTDTEKAIKKRAEIDRAVGYIKSSKPVNKVLGFYLKNTNLYSNEAELFGKNWAKAHEMESVELEQNRKVKTKTKQMIEKGKKIYGIPDDTGSKKMFKNSDKEFARIINEKSQENFTLHGVNGKATNLERKISLLQIMDIYNTIKNKNSAEIYAKLYETFDEQGNQTSHQIQGLIDNLSEQDKAFADAIMADIQSLREAENEIYVKLYGIDMPKHEPYYPRSAERVEGELMDIKKFAIGDDTPSFFKERAKMSLLVPRNMWTKYQSRINDSMYMTNTFEKYKEHYDLIHNSEVKNAIEAKYDTKRYMALNTSLKDLSLGGNSKAFDDMENFMSNLVSNWVVSKIALNDAVFTKQLLSMTNFIENMPVSDFFKYSLEMMTNPKKAFEFMQNFDGAYLNQRFSEGMQNEALAQIMANAERSVKKRDYIFQDYIDFVTLPVRLGDVGAIYLGGYARARYLLEHGTPIEEARRIFEFESQQSQQSGLKASMAQFQKNTIFRFFTAFKNTQLQYQRKMLDGFIQWRRGEIDTKHYAKILGNYAFLQAFMYQIATNIFSYWRDDDDDKEFDWSKDVAMQIITSPVAGVPLLGDMTQNLLKKQSYDLGIAGLQDANKAIRLAKKSFNSLIEGEFDPKTAEKAGALMLQFVKPMPANILTSILND